MFPPKRVAFISFGCYSHGLSKERERGGGGGVLSMHKKYYIKKWQRKNINEKTS
jgi:hypothetical protein